LRARAAVQLGEIEAAEGYINRALTYLHEDDVTAIAEAYDQLGLIREAQGRHAEAEAARRRAVSAVAQTEYNWMKTDIGLALVKSLVQRGALDEARLLLEEHESWAREQKIALWDLEIEQLRRSLGARESA
jgi:tetratricopeptide (TPR) repeat protein